jgi:iron complex outermembrane receptor protein
LNAGSWNSYKPTLMFMVHYLKILLQSKWSEYAESFRDVVQSEKYYFNPSFLFNLSDKSQLIVEADYLKNNLLRILGLDLLLKR